MPEGKRLPRKLHGNRDDLTGEHTFGDAGQIIFFIIFIAVWVLDSFVFKYSIFLKEYIPLLIHLPISILILALSVILSRAGIKTVFGKVREKPQVISTGVFSIVRHPIYLGSILLYLGLVIFTLSILSFLIWILIFIFYYLISRYEEKLLVERFGRVYEDYKKKVLF